MYPLAEETILNPKRLPVFREVFQYRIPKCISLIRILCCGQTELCEYFSVPLRFNVVFVRFSDRRFPVETFGVTVQFPVALQGPWSSQLPVFLQIHTTLLCTGLDGNREQSLTGERNDWQLHLSHSPPALLLLCPITFSYSSKLFSFGLLSSVFFMSHHLIVSLGFVLTVSSVLPLVFIPTLFLFLIFPLLVYTVLHGQFTKSDIHSPFSPETFNTIFNTETSKVENLEKERMKEN